MQICTSYVKAIESYRLTDKRTDRQTDRHDRNYIARRLAGDQQSADIFCTTAEAACCGRQDATAMGRAAGQYRRSTTIRRKLSFLVSVISRRRHVSARRSPLKTRYKAQSCYKAVAGRLQCSAAGWRRNGGRMIEAARVRSEMKQSHLSQLHMSTFNSPTILPL